MAQQQLTGNMFVPAPSTICLLCAACGRLVTPCLVCANLLPYCGSLAWVICRKCKLRNPLGEQERRLLGFPFALALPLSMVGRVQIAHVGRSSYVMAAQFQYRQMQQTFAEGLIKDMATTKTSDVIGEFSCCQESRKTTTKLNSINMPFLQCEGMVKRVQLTSDSHLLYARNTSPNVKDACRCSCSEHMPKEDNVTGKHMHHMQQALFTGKGTDHCHACGGKCQTRCWELSQFNEAELQRCQEHLLRWHYAESLSADVNCSVYPLCNSIVSPASNIVETDTCNTQRSSDCALQELGRLSLSILRSVNSFLEPTYNAWMAEKGAGSSETLQQLEDILATAERFLQNRVTLLQLQKSIHRAVAAQKQAVKDHEAALQQSLKSVKHSSLLKSIFADKAQARADTFTKIAEPFLSLLKQINSTLNFCYAQAWSASFGECSRFICTVTQEQVAKASGTVERGEFLEALRTAVSSWLLLYHDVAHATGVIGAGLEQTE